MAMSVEELLDALYEMLEDAKSVPLSGDKCMLERDEALDILDDIRAQFPVEFAEARKLLATRQEYLDGAKRESELIRQQAREQAKQMVEENQVMRQASQQSSELTRQTEQKTAEQLRAAEERARELKRAAEHYCDDLLRRAEEAVAEAGKELAQSRAAFRSAAGVGDAPSKAVYDVEVDD